MSSVGSALTNVSLNIPKNNGFIKKIDDQQGTSKCDTKKEILSTQVLENPSIVSLFVGNLPEYVTKEHLEKVFHCYQSSLVSVKICCNSTTKKSLCYGYLNFNNKEDAENATEEFNYKEVFKGYELKIMPSLRNKFYRKNIGTNVFFSNMPLDNPKVTTRVFYDTFRKYGKILSCKLDNRKNIGFIYFDNDQSATKAIIDYNGKEYFGSKILCGIHFDKDVRAFPEFEKRKLKLDSETIVKEELSTPNNSAGAETTYTRTSHPNAVFVKNLPGNAEYEELLDYFSQVGPIKSIYSQKVLKFNSLWSVIIYKNHCDVQRAIERYDGQHFKERKIFVSKAESRRDASSKSFQYTVIVQNIDQQKLKNLCQDSEIGVVNSKFTRYRLENSGNLVVTCRLKADALQLVENLNSKIPEIKARLLPGIQTKCQSSINQVSKANIRGDASKNLSRQSSIVSSHSIIHYPLYGRKDVKTNTGYQLSPASHYTYPSRQSSTGMNPCGNVSREFSDRYKLIKMLNKYIKESLGIGEFRYLNRDYDCISEYIIDVYWRGDVHRLLNFFVMSYSHQGNQRVLYDQVQEAIRFLGYASL